MRRLASLAVVAVCAAIAAPVHTQSPPSRVIDILVVYPPSYAVSLGGAAAVQARAETAVSYLNAALERSLALTRVVLAASVEVGEGTEDAFFAGLAPYHTLGTLRATHTADLVVFTRGGTTFGRAELAAPGSPYYRPRAFRGFVGQLQPHVFAHEVGHLLGLHHAKADFGEMSTDLSGATGTGLVAPYGYGLHVFGTLPFGAPVRTLMAESCVDCPLVDYFATPALSLNGIPLGDAASADSVRAIDENAPFVAAYSASCVYSVSPTVTGGLAVPAAGATYTYSVTTSDACLTGIRLPVDSWVEAIAPVPALHGTGNRTVTFAVRANTTASARLATVVLGDVLLPVTQSAACTAGPLSLTGVSVSMDGVGPVEDPNRFLVRKSVTVEASTTCQPSVSDDADWLFPGVSIVGGSAFLSFEAVANTTGVARSATVTVGGQTLPVTQAGACLLQPPVAVILPASGSGLSTFTSVTGAAACTWAASSPPSWLTFGDGQSTAAGSGNGVLTLVAQANTTGALRSGTMTIDDRVVQVFQLPDTRSCSVTVGTPGDAPAAGGDVTLSVSAPDGCPWAVTTDRPWMTVAGASTGVGSGSVTLRHSANLGLVREATVRVNDVQRVVTQLQGASPCPTSLSVSPSSWPVNGGAGVLTVSAPPGCTATLGIEVGGRARVRPAWLTFGSSTTVYGSGSIPVSLAANDLYQRAVQIRHQASSVTTTIMQAGALGEGCNPPPLREVTVSSRPSVVTILPMTSPGCEVTSIIDSAMYQWGQVVPVQPTGQLRDDQEMTVLVPVHTGGVSRSAVVSLNGVPAVRITQTPRLSCDYALSANAVTLDIPAFSTATVDVTSLRDCAWPLTSPAAWLAVDGPFVGSGLLSLRALTINDTASVRQATLSVGGRTLVVRQSVIPRMSASSSALTFRAIKAGPGGALTHVTPAQATALTFNTGSPSWSATANQPWVTLSATSGTGSGLLTIGVADPLNSIGGASSLQAVVRITSPGPVNSPLNITVNLAVDQTNGSTLTLPVGQVDTPAQNATGVQGAVGVTGWVLDDVGVTGVQIFRTCLPWEDVPGGDCQTILTGTPEAARVVFVGDAAFLAGARPDVEAGFGMLPQANRAGWGMLVLTPMLPDVTRSVAYGGQGALTLYAVATDVEGQKVLLGRSSDPASPELRTPTAILMDNDAIAKPFGTIDTPALGETISGVIPNFGWALTPDVNTTGGEPGDVLIPTNGFTMTVFIDGLPTAQVIYNQCRVPGQTPSTFCTDDVSNIFGNPTPQPSLQARTANTTRFRNLDVGRAPIGAYVLDTATLSNGLHTIAWSVSDSLGRTEGIGSRFFTVLNSGGDEATLRAAPAMARAPAWVLQRVPSGTHGVWARTGFDLTRGWDPVTPDDTGRRIVEISEGGRVELWLGAAAGRGFLVANGTLRDLPPGATLRGAQFGWVPPVGYIGDYALVFLRGGERIEVTVRIR